MGNSLPILSGMPTGEPERGGGFATRLRRILIGPPRDLKDRSIFRHLSLIAFLAWVGLGADGLSSSTYGPAEAFRVLGEHTYLAIALAAVSAATVVIIALAYSQVIEFFPHGGGGYVVATKVLGERAGVVSGSALLVDYVLTITVSIAAAGDALASLMPAWSAWKLTAEVGFIVLLILLNLRGVRESVLALTPIFLVFLATHLVLIAGGVFRNASQVPETLHAARTGLSTGIATLGIGGLLLRFVHAYSLGGGTYTGIEAVSNGLAIMREPRVQTGKRTMFYMAASLAFTAAGLLFCYLLWRVVPVEGKTLNAVLAERFWGAGSFGRTLVALTLVSEGALLVVAAQAGFVDGPRVLANMAVDSWMPRRFAALSDRLTTQNGIVLMGLASLAALLYTKGDVRAIVVMYSINVFLTFSITTLSMCRMWIQARRKLPAWKRRISIHAAAFAMCATILVVTVLEKFLEGGWITLAITSWVVLFCFVIRRHYNAVTAKLGMLYRKLLDTATGPGPASDEIDPAHPVAVVLVSGYGGLGLHTFLSTFREFPNQFRGAIFVSAGVIDSREFKGEGTVEDLKASVRAALKKYVDFARGQGIPASFRMAIGTDAVEEVEKLCLDIAREFPHAIFFAGKVLFEKERWYQRLLHNETAFAIQRRLQWAGRTVVVVPARIA